MTRIHREGLPTIGIVFLLLIVINGLVFWLAPTIVWLILILSLGFFLFILSFFRNPHRPLPKADDRLIYAPADGKVVVIEETTEPEYFKDRRIQVSIFMAVTNVHVNRGPVGGTISYFKYHAGKYLVAWHPKSSLENERATLVVKSTFGELLLRQIAGALARRIITYPRPGNQLSQGDDIGFIKFGSRVDLLLPLDAKVRVKVGDSVKGNKTVVCEWS